MKDVYLPRPAEGYELCHPLKDSDFESFNALVNGEPRTDAWSPIDMRLVHEDQGEVLKRSDSPWLGSHALILRKEVMFRFGQFLQEFGELLALKCDEAEMFVYNPTCLIDGLDEENSEIQRFSNGRIIRISKYAFNESRIAGLGQR